MENWTMIRNACRKRLRHHCETHKLELDDATQDACGFVVRSLQSYDNPESKIGIGYEREDWIAIAICNAVDRVKRRQTVAYEPRSPERWERYAHPHYLAKYGGTSDDPELQRINWFELENGIPA